MQKKNDEKKKVACLPWKTWRSLHSWLIVLRAPSFISGRRTAPLASPAFAAPSLGGGGARNVDILSANTAGGESAELSSASASAVPWRAECGSGGRRPLEGAAKRVTWCKTVAGKQLGCQLRSSLSQSEAIIVVSSYKLVLGQTCHF